MSIEKAINYTDKIKLVLFGVAVGDALGVPVEFKSRKEIKQNPLIDMIGYGTYNQPPGTWSDDSSLTARLLPVFTILNLPGNFLKAKINSRFIKTYKPK